MYIGLEVNVGLYVVDSLGSGASNVTPGLQSNVLGCQLLAFTVMKLLGVTRCLYSRFLSRDGEGFNFNTALQSSSPAAAV